VKRSTKSEKSLLTLYWLHIKDQGSFGMR